MRDDGRYILDADGHPVREPDLMAWGRWMERGDRIVAQDRFAGGVLVSTVFLGLDHRFGDGPPVLWESMIFGGPLDGTQQRYTCLLDALAGHADLCTLVQMERDMTP